MANNFPLDNYWLVKLHVTTPTVNYAHVQTIDSRLSDKKPRIETKPYQAATQTLLPYMELIKVCGHLCTNAWCV